MSRTAHQGSTPAARWLLDHPAPIRKSQLEAWQRSVRHRFHEGDLPSLLELLVDGDSELSYQAMGALRALGATVWESGGDGGVWDVRLPDGEYVELRRT